MRPAPSKRARATGRVAAVAAVCLSCLLASPAGPCRGDDLEVAAVTAGSAAIAAGPDLTTVHASDGAIIEYLRFDIPRGHEVRFVQPDSASRVLNRVISGDPSAILGRLSANGVVYLVNPAGVMFGRDAVVDVAGLIAAAGDIRDADFLAGVDRFRALQGEVVQRGELRGESFVHLLGRRVENAGTIVSPQGVVALTSGREVLLAEPGRGVRVLVDGEIPGVATVPDEIPAATPSGGDDGIGVRNSGQARGGEVLFRAGDLYGLAIQQRGLVRATDGRAELRGAGLLENRGRIESWRAERGAPAAARVHLEGAHVRIGGEVRAWSGAAGDAAGGAIDVLGDVVELTGATVTASGDVAGGRVRIGGTFHGLSGTRSAVRATVDEHSRIVADALCEGQGGRVVVWSDGTTDFSGSISARGGALAGDGGFVEVSSAGHLAFAGGVDTTAAAGRVGTLLLDPLDIEVTTAGGLAASDVDQFADAGSDPAVSQISPATLEAVGASVTLQARRDVTVTDAVTLTTPGAGITIQAGDDITINAPVTVAGGDLAFTANDGTSGTASGTGGIAVNSALDTTGAGQAGGAVTLDVDGGTGGIALAAGITTDGASIALQDAVTLGAGVTLATGAGAGDITLLGDVAGTSSGAQGLTLNAGGGAISTAALGAGTALGAVSLTGQAVTLGGDATTASGGTLTVANGGTLTVSPGVALTLDGAFAQTGAGGVSLGGAVTTTGDGVQFASAVTLTGDVSVDTTAAGASAAGAGITFSSTVDGDLAANARALTLRAGTAGDIALTAAAGGGERLGSVTVVSARDVNAAAIDATDLTQQAGSGTTTLAGVDTSGAAGVSLTGSAFSLTGAVTTAAGGGFAVVHGGGLAIAAAADLSLDGAFSESGGGAVTTAGDVTTTGDGIQFAGATTLTGDVSLDATAAGGSPGGAGVSFASTVDADAASNFRALTITAGSAGDVTLGGSAGSTQRLGAFTVTSAADVSAGSVTATTITQSAGSGASTFGALDASASGGIDIDAGAVTLGGAVTTANSGGLTVTNGGVLTVASGADLTLDGAFRQDGSGAVQLGAGVTTTGDSVRFDRAVTLTADVSVDTTSAGSSAAGANIDFQSTVDSDGATPRALTLRAGTGGDIALAGAAGGSQRLGAVTVTNARDVTAAALTAQSLRQDAGTGTTTLGAVDANGAAGIDLTGTAIALTGGVTTTGGGGLTVANSGTLTVAATADAVLDGAFAQSGGGAVQTAGDISTTGDTIQFGSAVTLTGDATFDATASGASSGGANITFASAVDGDLAANARSLTLDAGSAGDVTLSGALGAAEALGGVLVRGARDVTTGAITAATVTQTTGSGTTAIGGAVSTSGAFDVTAAAVQLASTLAAGGDITVRGDSIDLNGGAGSVSGTGGAILAPRTASASVGIAGGAGTLQLTNADLDALADGFSSITLGAASGSGAVTVAARTFTDPVAIRAPSGSGRVDVDGTLTGTGDASVTLAAGSGGVHLAAGVTTAGQAIDLQGAVVLEGDITLDATAAGATPAGANISASSTVDADGAAAGRGWTLRAGTAGDISVSGATGGGARLGDVVVASARDVTAAAITAQSLVQQAGTGTSTFAAIDTSAATGVDLDGSAFALTGAVTTAAGGGVTVTNSGTLSAGAAADLSLDGGFRQDGSGAVQWAGDITTTGDAVRFDGAVSLTGDVAVDTTSGGGSGAVTFSSTVDGDAAANARGLTLDAGSAAASFAGAVGANERLGDLVVSGAGDLSAGAITARSIAQTAGSGTTTLGGLDTSGAAGVALTTDTVHLTGAVATSGGGGVSISAASGLTIDAAADLDLAGGFAQNGSAPVSLGGDVVTAAQSVRFDGAVTLTESVVLSGSPVSFGSTLDAASGGVQGVSVTGAVAFAAAVGGGAPLASVTTTGGAALDADVTTTGLQDYGGAVTLGGGSAGGTRALTATAGGVRFRSVVDGDRALRVLAPGVGTRFDGVVGGSTPLRSLFTDAGGGTRVGADVTVGSGGIDIGDALAVAADAVLTTRGATSGILLRDAVDAEPGAGTPVLALRTLDAAGAVIGTGDIEFRGDIGQRNPLGSLLLQDDTGVAARALPASLASVFRRGDLAVRVVNDFSVGRGEKLTVLGALTVDAGGTVTLADTNTIGDLTVSAGTVRIARRAAGPLFDRVGLLLVDAGVEIIAGGVIDIAVAPTAVGAGADPVFATPRGIGDLQGTLGGFRFLSFGNLTASLFEGSAGSAAGRVLDLALFARSPAADIARALGGAESAGRPTWTVDAGPLTEHAGGPRVEPRRHRLRSWLAPVDRDEDDGERRDPPR